ncbi:MAG TPA: DUF4352 domain-containing protein [Actinomycetes bacterium]|nr:DUF4352 domain-containing protein [Actinomycetes bacterium]
MSTPAGWYDDPEQPGQMRYWDGAAWTDQRQPASVAPPPPQAPIGQTAITAPPQQKHTLRNVVLIVIGVFVLLVGGCTVAVVVAGGKAINDAIESADDPASKAPEGAEIRDGKFEFDVKSMECGLKQVSSGFSKEKAKGQFCVVTMTVSNIGDESQMFSDSDQYAYNAEGARYSADTGAGLALNKGDKGFLPEINPGNSINNVKVVYDIPADQEIVELELHDSFLSDGIRINAP